MRDRHQLAKKSARIGRTIATEKFPSTADGFWVSLNSDAVVNPYGFVTVHHICNTKTVGLVKELLAIDTLEIFFRARREHKDEFCKVEQE